MKRLGLILAASWFLTASAARAGELDAEYGGKAKAIESAPVVANPSSELDSESPAQACCLKRKFSCYKAYGCYPAYGIGYGAYGYGRGCCLAGYGGGFGYGGYGGGFGYGGFGGGLAYGGFGGYGGGFW